MEFLVFELTEVKKLFLNKFDGKFFGLDEFVNGDFVFSYAVEVLYDQTDFLNDLG